MERKNERRNRTDLEYARDLAVTTTDKVTVTFDVAAESYELRNTSGAIVHPITKAPSYVVNFEAQRGFERVNLDQASFGGRASVTFDETGAPVDAASPPGGTT